MSSFSCYLFGRFKALCNQQRVTSFHSQKALELLCYLLLNSDRPQNREILAEILWGNNCTRSKAYLRKAVWQLLKCFNANQDLCKINLLQVEPEWLHIKHSTDVWADVWVFEDAYNLVLEKIGGQFTEDQFNRLQDTVDLYQGDLLEGWYEDWCVFERERFKTMYLLLIDKLMECCEAHQRYELAIQYGNELLKYDQARERTHRRLIRLLYLKGDRTSALRQFIQCRDILEDTLNISPSMRTRLLVDQIKNDQVDSTVIEHIQTNQGKPALRDQIFDSLNKVTRLMQDQSSTQDQITREFRKLKTVLMDYI